MLFTVIGAAIISAMLVIFLKQHKPEYALMTAAAAGVVIALMVLASLSGITDTLRSLFSAANIDSDLFTAVIKAMGVCYITGFASDLCKDFGQSSLAGKIELAGKITVVIINIPIINVIIKAALELIG